MTGGGGKVTKGKMSSRIHDDVSPQQLVQMEKSLSQREKEFEVNEMAPNYVIHFMMLYDLILHHLTSRDITCGIM